MMHWPDRAPELHSERLRLRAFEDMHLTETYVGWLNDPEVVRYSEQRHRTHSLESCRAYWTGMREAGGLLWAIENDAERHIGNLSAHPDHNNQSAELAILIGDRASWGRGYGSEAWGAVSDYLLVHAGVRRLWAGTMAVNRGMRAIFEKTGMQSEGGMARVFLWEGQEVDLVQAARFASGSMGDT
jgi:ribosomal-protein-alanine N-acetyltransferase